jgi:hypothetical protein
MRGSKRSPWLFGLGVLLAVLVVYGGHARADVTTDQSASIIIFPKVIVDGTRDTFIQIANTDNMQANAECVYINTAGTCFDTPSEGCSVDANCAPNTCDTGSGTCTITTTQTCSVDTDCPPNVCVHQCTETNFTIFLTGQQPTYWLASEGREVGVEIAVMGGLFDGGFSPGKIQPLPSPFVGELKCIEVDASGAPVAQNSLKGEAVITVTEDDDSTVGPISEYNAIGIQASGAPSLQLTGQTVCAGGDNDGLPCSGALECPGGTCSSVTTGYNACPAALYVNHYGEGAVDSFTGAASDTELTLVPCSELLEQQTPVHASAVFRITTELEQSLSCSVPFDCALNARLSDLSAMNSGCNFNAALLGSDNLKSRIRPPTGSICYSGDARCHICTGAEGDIACLGVPVGTIVGNCSCGSDADCPNFLTATGSGSCSLTSGTSCVVPADCNTNAGCAGDACDCVGDQCVVVAPAACPIPGESCPAGQECSGAVSLGCRQWPGLLGVAEEFQTLPASGAVFPPGTAAVNLHMEGSRPGDVIIVP